MVRRIAVQPRASGCAGSIPVSFWSIPRSTRVGSSQIEIYFSIIQRKVLTPNDFANLEAIRLRLALYEELSNQSPTPFQWKFDRAKLTALLTKIETRRQSLADAQLKCRDEAA